MFEALNGGMGGEGQMNVAAISLHELYSSYLRAGFTEEQSFQLTLVWLKGAFGQVNG